MQVPGLMCPISTWNIPGLPHQTSYASPRSDVSYQYLGYPGTSPPDLIRKSDVSYHQTYASLMCPISTWDIPGTPHSRPRPRSAVSHQYLGYPGTSPPDLIRKSQVCCVHPGTSPQTSYASPRSAVSYQDLGPPHQTLSQVCCVLSVPLISQDLHTRPQTYVHIHRPSLVPRPSRAPARNRVLVSGCSESR